MRLRCLEISIEKKERIEKLIQDIHQDIRNEDFKSLKISVEELNLLKTQIIGQSNIPNNTVNGL